MIYGNKAIRELTGYVNEDLSQFPFSSFLTPGQIPEALDHIRRILKQEFDDRLQNYRIRTKSGEEKVIEARGSVVLYKGKPFAIQGIAHDITDRISVEQALKASKERYKNILDSIEDGYYEVDLAGNFTFCSYAFCRISGYSRDELLNTNFRTFMDDEDAKRMHRAVNQVFRTRMPVKGFAYERILKNGEKLPVETSVSPICDTEGNVVGFRGTVRDISERKALEEGLRQSRKMESIGTLTGGIAHDFNNILTIILGNAEMALDNMPAGNPSATYIEASISACLKAKEVIARLLSFARNSDTAQKPAQLLPVVMETMKFLRSSLPASITLMESFGNDCHIIKADPDQIRQILVDLAANAFHAMEKGGGTLWVLLENVHISKPAPAMVNDLTPGRYVRLSVKDTGSGIDPKDMDRIFDPYFTTREVGRGSGLGLAAVHGIVKSHGGSILLESRINGGTEISIFFPAIEQGVAEGKAPEEMPSGNDRILLIDDDELIVELGRKRLERLGYQVETERDPVVALERVRSGRNHFDLIITDMTMPKMTGDKLVTEIRKISPEIPVILCTGYSDKIDEDRAKEIAIDAFMMKPVDMRRLAQTVRKVLDERN